MRGPRADADSRSSGNFARLRKMMQYRKRDAWRPSRPYRLCDAAMMICVRDLLTRVHKKRMCYWRRIKILRTSRRSQSTLPPAAMGNATRRDVNWAACYELGVCCSEQMYSPLSSKFFNSYRYFKNIEKWIDILKIWIRIDIFNNTTPSLQQRLGIQKQFLPFPQKITAFLFKKLINNKIFNSKCIALVSPQEPPI